MSLRLGLILGACVVLLAAGGWISRSFWKPALDRAVAAAFNAQDDADGRGREAAGEIDTAGVADRRAVQRSAARQATHELELQLQEDPDANTPLDPDRAGRLHEHDGRLCALRPAVCGAAGEDRGAPAAARDAGVDARGLPAGASPARR